MNDKNSILQDVKDRGVRFIEMQFTDILGAAKSVTVPARQLEENMERGVWFDGSSIQGFARIQESDANYLNYKTVRSALSQMKTIPGEQKATRRTANHIKKLLKKDHHDLNIGTINNLLAQHHLHGVHPLYSIEDAEAALSYFEGHP